MRKPWQWLASIRLSPVDIGVCAGWAESMSGEQCPNLVRLLHSPAPRRLTLKDQRPLRSGVRCIASLDGRRAPDGGRRTVSRRQQHAARAAPTSGGATANPGMRALPRASARGALHPSDAEPANAKDQRPADRRVHCIAMLGDLCERRLDRRAEYKASLQHCNRRLKQVTVTTYVWYRAERIRVLAAVE